MYIFPRANLRKGKLLATKVFEKQIFKTGSNSELLLLPLEKLLMDFFFLTEKSSWLTLRSCLLVYSLFELGMRPLLARSLREEEKNP